jgi:5-carboxymethyl-2-hydroxymuconate isomerase
MLNLCGIVAAILKMVTGRNFSMSGIISGHHNLLTYEMLLKSDNVDIVVAILKMVTGRNFSMSGIISGHHNLPTYEMSLKSDNVDFVRHCGGHFENGER